MVDWGDLWEGEEGGREREGETMAHDEDYLMTFCSFLFLFFSWPVYIYFLMMKQLVHFTLFLLHTLLFLFCSVS